MILISLICNLFVESYDQLIRINMIKDMEQ